MVSYEDPRVGEVGLFVGLEDGVVRVAVPTDVEPTVEGLRWLLAENFSGGGLLYKYGVDYDGFVVVLVDVPAGCVGSARDLRGLIGAVVEGYRRLLERVRVEGGEGRGEGSGEKEGRDGAS